MIDLVYKTLQTIVNKDNQGYVSPTEFNLLAHNVQMEIFREYFEDENRDKNKMNKGNANRGYSNLPLNERQRIQKFSDITTITKADDKFTLPEDLYFIEDSGVVTTDGVVIDETERGKLNYQKKSLVAPTTNYPVYEGYSGFILVSPDSIDEIKVSYLRTPKMPNWTYFVAGDGSQFYNPADASFQDFELHESEFSSIVLKMLTYFGINLRETEIMQIAQALNDKINIKEDN